MLTISAKAIGRKKPLFADFAVDPPAALTTGTPVTLRQLLTHVVEGEVAAFKTRQAERRLLKALTAKQVEEGLASGKVDMGGSEVDQPVDVGEAVATAVEAFSDGLYLVVINETEVKDLDVPMLLPADSRLAFVRLTMLAGG